MASIPSFPSFAHTSSLGPTTQSGECKGVKVREAAYMPTEREQDGGGAGDHVAGAVCFLGRQSDDGPQCEDVPKPGASGNR